VRSFFVPSFSHAVLLALVAAPALGAGCGGERDAGASALLARPEVMVAEGCGISLDQVALYQGVEVVLGRRGDSTPARSAPIIAHRPALLRAFVTPSSAGPAGAEVTARLTIESPSAGARSYELARTITSPSTPGALGSTLNFAIPAADLDAGAALSLELAAPASCPGGPAARFPATGSLPLEPLRTGTLKVHLVPLRYDTDGSGRLPDTSPEQLERFRSLLLAIFPVAGVALEVGPVAGTTADVSTRKGWSELLEAMRALRQRDAPPPDVYYYGLVAPAPSAGAYCLGACIGGIAYVAGPGEAGLRVGAGLGFSGLNSADSMAHELGHAHGRPHAPCGAVGQPDPGYPYAGAELGGWGLDGRGKGTLAPPSNKDLMSYCAPRWISDYTFEGLAARSAHVNSAGAVVSQALRAGPPQRWRVLLIDGAGRSRWGLEAAGPPPGAPAAAEELDETGAVRGTIEVWRAPLGDEGEAAYWVPLPATPRRGAIRVAGAEPARFAEPPAVVPLY
jgi:hypothetical protein